MTVHYSVDFLVLQRKSFTNWGLTLTERRVKWGELVEDGECQWLNFERKFGFVKVEKTMSVLLQSAWLKESSLVIMIEQEQFCALPKMELYVAKAGRDRQWAMFGNRRTGKNCVALRDRWWLQNWSWRRKSQLTKKERDSHCQGLWLKERQKCEPRRVYVLFADM